MSFLKRIGGHGGHGEDAAAIIAPGPILGADQCSEPGCPSHLGVPCAYVDRRGRVCGTSWCPEHHLAIDDRIFCRRHSGVVRAIAANTLELFEYPDIDNRAASLCQWVANDLDPLLRALLTEQRTGHESEQVSSLPMRLVIQRQPAARAWVQAWTLSDNTGVIRKIGVQVDEANDVMVVASVDGNEVVRGVPPWIADRIPGFDDVTDEERRADFRAALIGPIAERARLSHSY
ncbi:MAG: hypothetical protein M3O87_06995 [Candidatus Dormibacteraeota bacterium]|nr:hypothetical protein [Candidatus Dormibacteraeota bacterium]